MEDAKVICVKCAKPDWPGEHAETCLTRLASEEFRRQVLDEFSLPEESTDEKPSNNPEGKI